MRMFFPASLAIAAVGMPACFAQGARPADLNTTLSNVCPASIVARHESTGASRWLAGGVASGQAAETGQGLQILMTGDEGKRIVAADVTLHAISARARVLALGATSDLTRTFHLAAGSGSAPSFSAQVWMANAGAILSVDVVTLHYADGTEWHAPTKNACTVRPELYMEVAAAR